MKRHSPGFKQIMRQLTASSRRVDFLVCGAQKGGTTSLQVHLREHPEICMSEVKGLHYFDDEELFAETTPKNSLYHCNFRPHKKHKRIGEATPIYMYWEPAIERIQAYNPEIQIIVLLRNPIARAYSNWNMQVTKKCENLPFREALDMESLRRVEALPLQSRTYSYVDRGFYSRQLKRLWAHFPREQVLILKSEEFWQSPRSTLDQVCDFLGLSYFDNIAERSENARSYKSKMSEEDWLHLRAVFEHEIHEVESLLQWDCSDWLAPTFQK